MPPKIRDLLKHLESAGFIHRGGKGSHRNFKHPAGINITISGKLGSDAKPYQEQDVKKALERTSNAEKK
jgi:predicted RNA binding protein YcfA (HicA-like mRNA interferase family)